MRFKNNHPCMATETSKPGTKNNLPVLKIAIVIKSGNQPLF